jgi:hypothetical protein
VRHRRSREKQAILQLQLSKRFSGADPKWSLAVLVQIFSRGSVESRHQFESEKRRPVIHHAGVASVRAAETCVEKLAQLFPGASRVRIPVRVSTLGPRQLQEEEVIEFGTPQEVLFACTLPLEFEDRVRLVNSDGSLDAHATVIAVRYHNGGKAVAARFSMEVGNWIIKP